MTFAVATLFGQESLGQFSLASRVLVLPGALIATALRQVFARQLADRRHSHQPASRLYRATLLALVPVAVAIVLITVLAGPTIFQVVFGPQWELAGEYARALSPLFALALLATTVSPVTAVLERQRAAFVIQCLAAVVPALAWLIGASSGLTAEGYLWLCSLGGSLVFLGSLAFYAHALRQSDLEEVTSHRVV